MAYPSNSDSVAADQIIEFVRDIELIEEQIAALNGDKSETYKDAKAQGFDVKVLRKIIADRRKDAAEREEFDAIYAVYWNAVHGLVRARVETIEQFPAEPAPKVEAAAPSDERKNEAGVPDKVPVAPPAGGLEPVDSATGVEQASGIEPSPEGSGGVHGLIVPTPPPLTEPERIATRFNFNPATHFKSSGGLLRLHGCQEPDVCAGTWRELCASCRRVVEAA